DRAPEAVLGLERNRQMFHTKERRLGCAALRQGSSSGRAWHHDRRLWGSIASRSASPTRLSDSRVAASNRQGNSSSHQFDRYGFSSVRPSAARFPHDGSGGFTPIPRKLR